MCNTHCNTLQHTATHCNWIVEQPNDIILPTRHIIMVWNNLGFISHQISEVTAHHTWNVGKLSTRWAKVALCDASSKMPTNKATNKTLLMPVVTLHHIMLSASLSWSRPELNLRRFTNYCWLIIHDASSPVTSHDAFGRAFLKLVLN